MFKKLLLMLFVMIFTIGSPIYAMTSSNIDKLNQKSDEALQMMKIKRDEDALHLLRSFSEELLAMAGEENAFNSDELKIITAAYDGALKSLQTTENTYDYKVNALTKLRLVVDAVSSNHRPLWTELEESMMSTFSETKKAVSEKNSQQFHNELNALLIQYDLIYYSLQVDVKPETIQTVDARFQYLDQYRPQIFENVSSQKELDELQYEMKAIFDEMKKDEADPSLWWVIISTGSIIISTLSYVGWRKYKGTKETVRSKNNTKD
ncbi:sporulation protein YpjB [Bacillus sp. JJ722]|uniref:sporulation protein YpjB n=1 Tax=Bacillus sp. JJ722 TaxID=3122973 RepID=UPI002FFF27EF